MLKEMSRRVVVMDVVGVVLGLAFTWLPSRSDGVADQRLAESLQILGIDGEDILFVLGQVAGDGIDGAEIDDGGVDGSAHGHDRDPSDEVALSPLNVVVHDGAAAVVFGVIPSDRHRRLGAVQNADGSSGFARLGEWASCQVRTVHLKRSAKSKSISGSDVDVVTMAGNQARDGVSEDVDG